ncbi:conserved membrane protein of unknown function [Tenacibaculum sp. 190130A14a]|uniref:Uncharacterized protein n=1 Tax=Tenacibaculum polynesiense TaxID=3137857 RepID=A0ABM9PFQ6_9FLAO
MNKRKIDYWNQTRKNMNLLLLGLIVIVLVLSFFITVFKKDIVVLEVVYWFIGSNLVLLVVEMMDRMINVKESEILKKVFKYLTFIIPVILMLSLFIGQKN